MAKAYIQEMNNRDGDSIYPVTTADAVYLQKTDESGVITQQTLTKKLESMETSFQDGVDTIVAKLTALGVTPTASTPEAIAEAIQTMYTNRYNTGYNAGVTAADNRSNPNSANYKAGYSAGVTAADNRVNTDSANYKGGYSAGQSSVTVTCTMSGRTATAKTSTGKTATASAALGTNNGTLTATLTPTGNNTATKAYAAGWYNAGTITANGATSYSAGKYGASLNYSGEHLFNNSVRYDESDACFEAQAQLRTYNIKLSNGVITLSGTEKISAADCDGHSKEKNFTVSQSWNIA